MKKLGVYILALLAIACNKEQPKRVLELTQSVTTISVGDAAVLELKAEPTSLLSDVVWTSSDTAVVRVVSGIVTGVSKGASTITASSDGLSAQCLVVVQEDEHAPTYTLVYSRIRMARSQKRGVGYGSPFMDVDVPLLAPYMQWAYNWGPDMSTMMDAAFSAGGLEFCPMAWNGKYDAARIRTFAQAHPDCQYLLAFNEPNLTDQANMTPEQAAVYWPDLVALAKELNLKLVSPAMNYGTLSGYSDPVKWLDDFFAQPGVSIDDVDAISLHCYMASAGSMKSFIDRFDKYNKKIWLTEFCAWEKSISSVQGQMGYMSEAIGWLEQDERVERYAWFLPRGSGAVTNYPYNQLLGKTEPLGLSELGNVFVGMPIRHNEYLNPAHPVLLNTCSDWSSLSGIPAKATPHFCPAGDSFGSLYAQMYTDHYLTFLLDASQSYSTIAIEVQAYTPTTLEISVDGVATSLSVKSSETWALQRFPCAITAGKHTVTIRVTSGNLLFHWFVFEK